jgi:hypothetical protein
VWGYCSALKCDAVVPLDLTTVDEDIFGAFGGREQNVSRCSQKNAKCESRYSVSDVFTRGAMAGDRYSSRSVDEQYSRRSVFISRLMFHT